MKVETHAIVLVTVLQ